MVTARCSSIPDVPITRYHNDHRITLLPETPPTNFCLEDLDMFADFFFKDTLELYDWCTGGEPKTEHSSQPGKSHKFFYFVPRFERLTAENGNSAHAVEVLSMDKVRVEIVPSGTRVTRDYRNISNPE